MAKPLKRKAPRNKKESTVVIQQEVMSHHSGPLPAPNAERRFDSLDKRLDAMDAKLISIDKKLYAAGAIITLAVIIVPIIIRIYFS